MSYKTRYEDLLRWFTGKMGRKLTHLKDIEKPHWLERDLWGLFHNIQDELVELLIAVRDGDLENIEGEATNIAISAMIIADKARNTRRKMNVIIHPSITREAIVAAAEADDSLGFCVSCGQQTSGVEPDAREYKCESCGDLSVYGAEELLLHVT